MEIAKIKLQMESGDMKLGWFASYDLAHFDRLEAQDENGKTNALGKKLEAMRQKLWRDIRAYGCSRITQSFYRIPEDRLELVTKMFESVESKLDSWGVKDNPIQIFPINTASLVWDEMNLKAMKYALSFLQRKINFFLKLDASILETKDKQRFVIAKKEVSEIIRMVESTKELRESPLRADYENKVYQAQTLITSDGEKVKRIAPIKGVMTEL